MTTNELRITGFAALCFARLCHAVGLDIPEQWGHAYFRCPTCGWARDCTGEEDWDRLCLTSNCSCEHDFTVDDLVISEGWLECDFEKILRREERTMTTRKSKCRPASKRYATRCPRCFARWPVVQALWDGSGENRRLINCCTHCGIEGEIKPRCPSMDIGQRCVLAVGHEGKHRAIDETGKWETL